MGVRIPLSEFQKEVLDWLLVAPSQLQPNAWGFLRGFEMVMAYLGRTPTAKVFLCFFNVLCSLEKGSGGKRQGAITFRCNGSRSIFLPANDSNKDYKEHFFFIRAVCEKAKATVKDYEDRKLVRRHFPWSWCRRHFVRSGVEIPNNYYATQPELLKGEDKVSYDLLNRWGTKMSASVVRFK